MVSTQSILGVLLTFVWGLILYFTYGRYGEPTIYFALILSVFGSIAFLSWKRLSKRLVSLRSFEIGMWFLVLVQIGFLCNSQSLIYVRDLGASQNISSFLYWGICFWVLAGSGFFISSSFPGWVRIPLFPILSILFIVIAKVLVVSASPTPAIDVHIVLTQATDNFLDFKNPYTGTYPDIYGGAYGYAPTFSYWPGALYLLAPFRFLGLDIRYGLWVCDLVTGALLGFLAFKKFSSEILAFSFALLWLALPVSFFVLEQAWLDTVIVAGAVMLLLCMLHDRFKMAALIAGFMVTVKQYAGFYVLFGMIEFFSRARILGISLQKILKWCGLGLLSFFVVMLPFVLVNPKAFHGSTIALYETIPMRLDALTLRVWVALRTRVDTLEFFSNPIVLLLGLASLMGWCLIQLRKEKPPLGLTYVVSSFILFSCIFLFGTHSFCNQYYFLTIWPLLISLV